LTEDYTSLVQVQADRFAFNWRQVEGTEPYPRYRDYVRPTFEHLYRIYEEVATADGKAPSPAWCEITYINHIDAEGSASGTHGPLSQVLRSLRQDATSDALPPVEDTQLQQRFLLADDNDEAIGRLYLSATPAFRADDKKPIYVLSLLVRGKAQSQTVEGVLSLFDLGRDLIVRGFTESTTSEMHERWGLRHG
jgi:uncharacterized protein (TIGR04255 family)